LTSAGTSRLRAPGASSRTCSPPRLTAADPSDCGEPECLDRTSVFEVVVEVVFRREGLRVDIAALGAQAASNDHPGAPRQRAVSDKWTGLLLGVGVPSEMEQQLRPAYL